MSGASSYAPTVIYVIGEGETEETFVSRVLRKYIEQPGKHLKLVKIGGLARNDYPKLRKAICSLLRKGGAVHVTTFIDLYALPKNFPGRQSHPPKCPYEEVKQLEKAFQEDIGRERFIPYLMLHEFEALLLTKQGLELMETEWNIKPSNRHWKRLLRDLERVKSPEELDEGPDTHPSARLKAIFPRYKKVVDGVRLLEQIPLEVLCEKCPDFGAWVEKLRSL